MIQGEDQTRRQPANILDEVTTANIVIENEAMNPNVQQLGPPGDQETPASRPQVEESKGP